MNIPDGHPEISDKHVLDCMRYKANRVKGEVDDSWGGVVKLMALSRYPNGYRGIVAQENRYLFFLCPRKGPAKAFQVFSTSDFIDDHHFIEVMGRFMARTAFLHKPIAIAALAFDELEKAWAVVSSDRRK